MSSSVIEANLDRIRIDLHNRGLTYDPLMDDLLDHVCCMVEDEMESGNDFDASYKRAMSVVEPDSISNIQHQTLLLLNRKFQRMKNFTYLFGLSSAIIAIIGAIFKRMHWPGAGILLTAGIVLVILGFLPLYFIVSNREQPEKKNPIYAIVGYFTLAFILGGALFKIMHWPGANIMIEVSLAILLIGFVPLYVVNAFQKGGKEKVTLPYIVMLLLGISVIMIFANVNMSKHYLDMFLEESLHNEARIELIEERSAELINTVYNDSSYVIVREPVTMIHDRARALQIMITEMQEGMKAHVNQPGVPIENIKGIDNRAAGREAIVEHGDGRSFGIEAMNFKEMLFELIDDPVTRSQLETHLEFTGKIWQHAYGPRNIVDFPFMKSYYKLSETSIGVALGEYVAISYLMHQ